MAAEITSAATDSLEPNKKEILDEVKIDLNFDRTTSIIPISGGYYYLTLNNCNVYDMAYKVKIGGVVVETGVIGEFKQKRVKIEFKPTVVQRQYVLVNYNDTTQNTCSPTILVLVDKIST